MRLSPLFVLPLLLGCGNSNSSSSGYYSNELYPYAWHLHYSSDVTYPASVDKDAHIHLKSSWSKSQGEDLIVAIIDDSFETTHEDLQGQIVDTYNTIDKSKDVTNSSSSTSHGTMVAGIIAAKNNSVGSLGIAYKSQLMLIKVDLDSSDEVTLLEAFEYAKEHGAHIINCSWGSYHMSEALEAKITEVVQSGITVVFAAGNDNKNLDDEGINDESEHPLVIGVGASDQNNMRAYYSNYGSNLDILAPAGSSNPIGIITTDESGQKGSNSGQYPLPLNYTYMAGSSASAPIISGVVALALSYKGGIKPQELQDKLQKSGDKIGDIPYDERGFNPYYGYGKVNVDALIESL